VTRRSIRFRINVLILFFCLIFTVVCLHLYTDHRNDVAERSLKRIYELEKDFSSTALSEETLLASPGGIEALAARYRAVERSCSECHPSSGTLISDRAGLLQVLYDIRKTYHGKLTDVRNALMELVDSVGYIHEHHIAYLKNFLRNSSAGALSQGGGALRDAEPEVEIIRVAVQVQDSLISILKCFNDLQIEGARDELRTNFESRFGDFLSSVRAFDDVSLDSTRTRRRYSPPLAPSPLPWRRKTGA
jgi:hypothetical protein